MCFHRWTKIHRSGGFAAFAPRSPGLCGEWRGAGKPKSMALGSGAADGNSSQSTGRAQISRLNPEPQAGSCTDLPRGVGRWDGRPGRTRGVWKRRDDTAFIGFLVVGRKRFGDIIFLKINRSGASRSYESSFQPRDGVKSLHSQLNPSHMGWFPAPQVVQLHLTTDASLI